jgi:hypothetical protein
MSQGSSLFTHAGLGRIVSWWSHGAVSTVATKLAQKVAKEKYPDKEFLIVNCEVVEEHEDNKRFRDDCESWFDQEIIVLGNDKYKRSIYDVFAQTGYLVGPDGARCTAELKKKVRYNFQHFDDVLVFGYTVDEDDRAQRIMAENFDTEMLTVVADANLTHADCLSIIQRAGIRLPQMYCLGFRNNNCIGCVKGGMGYWNRIRIHFPEVFIRMDGTEQSMGRTVLRKKIKMNDGSTKSIPLPLCELDPNAGLNEKLPDISCGIFCQSAEESFIL